MRFILAFAVSLFVALICTDQLKKNTGRFLFAFNCGRCGLCLRYLTGSSCRLLGLFHPIHATLHARNGILCHRNVRRRFRREFPCSQKVAACSSPAFNLRLPSLSGPCFLLRENLSCSARKLSAIALFRHFGKLNSFSHYFRNPRSSACHPRHHVLHLRESENEGFLVEEYPAAVVRILHAHHCALGNNPRAACTFGQYAGHRKRRCVGAHVRLICGAENQKGNQTAPNDRCSIAYEGSLPIPQRRALSAKHLHRASRMPHLTNMKFQRIKAYRATSAA